MSINVVVLRPSEPTATSSVEPPASKEQRTCGVHVEEEEEEEEDEDEDEDDDNEEERACMYSRIDIGVICRVELSYKSVKGRKWVSNNMPKKNLYKNKCLNHI